MMRTLKVGSVVGVVVRLRVPYIMVLAVVSLPALAQDASYKAAPSDPKHLNLNQVPDGKFNPIVKSPIVPFQLINPYVALVPSDGVQFAYVPTGIPGYSQAPGWQISSDYAQLLQAQTAAIKELSDRLKLIEDRLKSIEQGKP